MWEVDGLADNGPTCYNSRENEIYSDLLESDPDIEGFTAW
jgi:hypothetical protein